jgi:hypothetical protein
MGLSRKSMMLRLSATLEEMSERGEVTRCGTAHAADTSVTTVGTWFNGERLPDIHDVHLLCLNLPEAGGAILNLLTEGSLWCMSRSDGCADAVPLAAGVGRAIAEIQAATALARDYEAVASTKILTPFESAKLLEDIAVAERGLCDLKRIISSNTARRSAHG